MAAEDGETRTPSRVSACSGGSPSASHRSGGDDPRWWRRSLVEMEMDAARVLADFAQMALLKEGHGRRGCDGERGWESKEERPRRRSKKRTKSSYQAGEDLKERWSSSTDSSSSWNPQHSRAKDNPNYREAFDDMNISELKPDSRHLSRHVSFCGSRGKQNPTEAEKEAKRLRRVLANRESARQTILRRQARCEELAKKAAELFQENEKMKMEKELVMKEYLSLRRINMQLKEQMAKTMKLEIREDPSVPDSMQPEFPTSSTMHPLIMHDSAPLLQSSCFCGPKISNSMCPRPQPRSSIMMPHCPWFFPLFYQSASCSSPSTGCDGGEGSNKRGQHPNVRADDSVRSCGSMESIDKSSFTNKRVEHTSPSIDTSENKDAADDVRIAMPAKAGTPTVEAHRAADVSIHPSSVQGKSGENSSTGIVPEKPVCVFHPSKKLGDASAAAEARKRRKELAKLKQLLCRQR